MSKISIIAKLVAKEDKAGELEAALGSLIAAADEEPGLEVYSVSRDSENANTFYFFELYSDAEALKTHGKGDAMKAAMGALGGLLAGRPEIHRMAPIAAKGLDF